MTPRSRVPVPTPSTCLAGIGVGPGDPELVTLKAVRLLHQADAVLVPATEASGPDAGRAEQIVRSLCTDAAIVRVPFSMADRSGVTDRRAQAWQASADAALAAFADGATLVAFATIGDPSVYSTFSYLADRVLAARPDVSVEVVPGITAMQAIAAASRTPLVEGTEVLALVPATRGPATLTAVLDVADTVVTYKGGRHLPDVVDVLARHDRLDDAVLAIDLGLPTQHVGPLADAPATAPYFSTVLAAPRRTTTGGRL